MVNPRKPGCLIHLLAVGILMALIVWGVKACGRWISAPETPDAQAGRQEAASRKAAEEAVREQREAVRWAAEQSKQPERKEVIAKLVAKGVFRKVEFSETGHLATIWVAQGFYLLDFQAKGEFCNVVWAYLATHHMTDMVGVRLKDGLSGKAIGEYDPTWGLKLK